MCRIIHIIFTQCLHIYTADVAQWNMKIDIFHRRFALPYKEASQRRTWEAVSVQIYFYSVPRTMQCSFSMTRGNKEKFRTGLIGYSVKDYVRTHLSPLVSVHFNNSAYLNTEKSPSVLNKSDMARIYRFPSFRA